MSFRNLRRAEVLLALLLVVSGTLVYVVNRALDAYETVELASGDVGPLPDGKVLHVAALGFERLLADLFWLRTIYYVGDERSQLAGFPALERLSQLVTDVDPEFKTAYTVMSSALQGLAGDPAASVRLLEKGIQHVEYWKLHFMLGFNYFFEYQDYAPAAEQMRLASQKGGPPYLKLLTSRLYAASGAQETAMAFVRARLTEAESDEEREVLSRRYRDLWISRDLERIDRAIETFRERGLGEPESVTDLVSAGLLEQAPIDPAGAPYGIVRGHAWTSLEHDPLEVHLGAGAGRGRAQALEEEAEAEKEGER